MQIASDSSAGTWPLDKVLDGYAALGALRRSHLSLRAVVYGSLVIAAFSTSPGFAHDFRQYTTIDSATKRFLRTNRLDKADDSTYSSGMLSIFGSSLIAEYFFWQPVPESDIGAVPGTVDSSYRYKCASYGGTIHDGIRCIDNGLDIVKPEVCLLMFGVNETLGTPEDYDWGPWKGLYGSLLDSLLARGMIPIVSTLPPLSEYSMNGVDTFTQAINDTIRSLARDKQVVLTDYYDAVVEYTDSLHFQPKWYGDRFVHPSAGCEFDTAAPQCGVGIQNAVCWMAIDKVYRVIVENGPPDSPGGTAVHRNTAKWPRIPPKARHTALTFSQSLTHTAPAHILLTGRAVHAHRLRCLKRAPGVHVGFGPDR